MISQSTIDEVFLRMDVVEVVGQWVDLKQTGSTLRGRSPFQDEKTPSFYVVPSKGIFKDFSSGLGGNAIRFLMEKERYNYPEAIKWLCDFYKIEYKTEQREQSEEQREKHDQAVDLLRYVETKYSGALAGSMAEAELLDRGLSRDEIVEWGLGYARNEWDFVTHSIVERGMASVATEMGLVRKGRKMFDALKGRITIPVHDHNGVLRGFAGRICKAHETDDEGSKVLAKYVNPDNSFYYDKSTILYGLDRARKAIVECKKVYALEGYMDVIAAHRMHMCNAVGVCGTAITPEHLRLLKRLMKTPHIVLAFDADKAGHKATMRSVDICLEHGFKVEVCQLKEAKDLDQFVAEKCLTDNTATADV